METSPRPEPKNGAFDARRTARRVRREFNHATTAAAETAEKFSRSAQRHPYVSAAVILGTGVLVGVLVSRILAPKPTPGGLLRTALNLAREALTNGARTARDAVA